MEEGNCKNSKSIKETWGKHAEGYDEWYETFEGAVQHHVEWELLKDHLPPRGDARILDAAGGTGRITLPLAKMGFSVTLCDISPQMLQCASQKLLREGLLNKVKIVECDVRKLRFADESFDFVICWDGMFDAAQELIRVTKRGGGISLYLVNRLHAAIDGFHEDPASAISILESTTSYVEHHGVRYQAVSSQEAWELFEAQGINVIDIYPVWGWMEVLRIPEDIRESRNWDETFFRQTVDMLMRLSKEPSVSGVTYHLVLYGKRM